MDLGCQSPPSRDLVGEAMAVFPCTSGQEVRSDRLGWTGHHLPQIPEPREMEATLPSCPGTCHMSLAPWGGLLGTGQECGRQREPFAASITLTSNSCPSLWLGGTLRLMGLSQ